MKKFIIANLVFCILVITGASLYFDSKAKKAIVYHYVAEEIEQKYEVSRKGLEMDIDYQVGPGLYEVLVREPAMEREYFYEIDISDDYSLLYLHNSTWHHNKNKQNQ